MTMTTSRLRPLLCAALTVCFAGLLNRATADEPEARVHRFHVSLLGGVIVYEGDEAVDGLQGLTAFIIGYDLSPHLTLETVFELTPRLGENMMMDWEAGEAYSILARDVGRDIDTTHAWRLGIDALWQLAPGKRTNPYLALGVGMAVYGDDFGRQVEPLLRVGCGVAHHLTDRLALRGDLRVVLSEANTEFNVIGTAGLMWRFGGSTPAIMAPPQAAMAPALQAWQVAPDPAVLPADAATETADMAVKLFELRMRFDPGQAVIKPEYYSELDVVGRLLREKQAATARIAGHVDSDKGVSAEEAQALSLRRAEAVQAYLQKNWKLAPERLSVEGHGDTQPKPQADPEGNERIEVYVTGS